MHESDLKRLEEAVKLLEHPRWIGKNYQYGWNADWLGNKKPSQRRKLNDNKSNRKSYNKALVVAVSTMDRKYRGKPSKWAHRFAVVTTGVQEAFSGLPGLAYWITHINSNHAQIK